MRIGLIGVGIVGEATKQIFQKAHEIFPYDKYKEPFNSEKHIDDLAEFAEVIFVCVPTPMKPSGEIDCSAIHNSLNLLDKKTKEKARNQNKIIMVIRSTVVPGSTDNFEKQYPFQFAFNPEFLREKHALEDMENQSRIIIGTNNLETYSKIEAVYKPLLPNAKYISVDIKTAEMIKYSANVILTGQIAIANEIYQICQRLGVNYDTIKKTILLDERIGTNIDIPGPDGNLGFGGKCFPKDLNALIYLARENKYRPYLLEEIWRLNEKVRKDKNWMNIDGATSEKNYQDSGN